VFTFSDISIVITTFNRLNFVESQGRSLSLCRGIDQARIFVFDDASTEYTAEKLSEIYPQHSEIFVADTNSGGADYATRIALDFVSKLNTEIIVLLDSDLIISSRVLENVIELMPKSSGFFSLFNAPSHNTLRVAGEFVVKDYVGAAGCVFSQRILSRILEGVPPGPGFDWRFGDYLKECKIPILSVRDSLVQHIGFANGQHSHSLSGDFGTGFLDYSPVNTAAIHDAFLLSMRSGLTELWCQLEDCRRELRELKDKMKHL
jgi:glycosyltransferase involved in cell wall biosynthesis